jgi:uncharacterized protein (DUF305 family)
MASETQDLAATDESGTDQDSQPVGRYGTGMKVFLATGVVFIALLIGATGGLLIAPAPDERSGPPGANSVDVGFSQDMSVHHRQAVAMAGVARDRSADPAIKTLAFDIEATQQGQIGMMGGWLMLWNQPTMRMGKYMAWMTAPANGHDGTHGSAMPADGVSVMPGMATPEEIAKLRSLSGRELDVFVLQLLFRHHAGGTAMAQFAAEHAREGAVRALADSIAKSQGAEMETIKSMLAERGAQPLS